LWWPDGNIEQAVSEYRMAVPPFAAVSCPSSNFAPQRTAKDFEVNICQKFKRPYLAIFMLLIV